MMFWQNQGKDVDFAANPTRWYCIEAHVRVNDSGQSNGVIEAWVDDVLVMRYTGMDLSPGDDYFRAVMGTGSKINTGTRAIARWTDDLALGTQRIGCRAAPSFS